MVPQLHLGLGGGTATSRKIRDLHALGGWDIDDALADIGFLLVAGGKMRMGTGVKWGHKA